VSLALPAPPRRDHRQQIADVDDPITVDVSRPVGAAPGRDDLQQISDIDDAVRRAAFTICLKAPESS